MSNVTRLAVVGFGLVGRRHAHAIARVTGLELVGIVESAAAARESARDSGFRCFSTLDTLLNEGAVDGVVLATPTPLHVDQALTCIECDVPILVEKPIADSAQRALLLTRAASEKGIPVLVGHHRRHNGRVRAAKAAIDAGAIGDIRAIQATCWLYKPDHYFQAAPWRTKKGAGPISVNLVHDVDLIRHFCGEVVRVQGLAMPSARGHENEDLAAAILSFENGAAATLSVSDSIAAPWSWELTAGENPAYPSTGQSCYLIGGTSGSLSLPDLRVWTHDAQPDWWSPISARHLLAEANDPLVAQISHFAQVIRGEASPMISGVDGLRSLQVVEAIQVAANSTKPVEIIDYFARQSDDIDLTSTVSTNKNRH